ncbi:F-box/LRR-repeat protein 13-like isoform X2 [Rutidosis leptorrhynchoides]|uniref:F-box/LRR-repeat protein 13-like isoform X2 n=1 Tax=Rutidosis leptorrhynchoides TaxID=125765 RepID=UPI003A99DD31
MEANIIVHTNTTTMVDRISQLPESVVHHILSFLNSPRDLVRISVLSREWFAITASLPYLEFNIHHFELYERNVFFNYVAYTISRFRNQNFCLHTFKITIDEFRDPKEVDAIDECLGLMLKKCMQVLVINDVSHRMSRYRLPDVILSISSLTSLTIKHCDLPSSLMVDGVKFKSLKLLKLVGVRIDEKIINYLANCCTLLEKLYLIFCDGFTKFCVYGHQNLRDVRIAYHKEVERIDIEAPNLSYLFLNKMCQTRDPCMNLAKCKKLTTLTFVTFTYLDTEVLSEFLIRFPFIENLILYIPRDCNKLTFSSDTLRTLALCSRCEFENIMIDAPNLLFFMYSHHPNYPSSHLVRNSAESKTQKVMECYPDDDIGSLWFQQLREFLDKNNGFKVLKLHISASFVDVAELKRIQTPPYELEHIVLELDTIKELSVYTAVVDAVLWCFCPRSLSLTSKFSFINFAERNHVVKFTYDKLLQQEQGQTNIQIVLSSTSKEEKHMSNLTSLLKALPSDQLTQTITFFKLKSRSEGSEPVKGM